MEISKSTHFSKQMFLIVHSPRASSDHYSDEVRIRFSQPYISHVCNELPRHFLLTKFIITKSPLVSRLASVSLFLLWMGVAAVQAGEQQFVVRLLPPDYVDPRTLPGFICGMKKEVDPDRIIAEQNVPFLFEYIDRSETFDSEESFI